MIKKQNFRNELIFWAVFAIFSCALVVNKLVNLCFYLLLLVALVDLMLKRNASKEFWAHCKQYWPINLAMCSAFIALLLRQISQGEFSVRLYDLPSRFAVFALIFWALLKLPTAMLKKVKWGFICGAIFYSVTVYIDSKGGQFRVGNINSFSIIFSSELALLMGVFALLSINWKNAHPKLVMVAQIVAGLCGLYSVYLSQTRGAWIAIPFFIFIIISTLMHAQKARTKVVVYIVTFLALTAIFSATDIVQERLGDSKNDITELTVKRNLDTSIGVRLQLWNASWIMFREHPLFGVGKEHFSDELQTLKQRGVITEAAAVQYHSHNEILYGMSTLGIFGLFAILITYIVPASYFAKYMFHKDAQVHSAAAMGLSLCVGFVIFGLVDVMFGWNMCDVFYCTTIAVLLAFIVNKNKELENQSGSHLLNA